MTVSLQHDPEFDCIIVISGARLWDSYPPAFIHETLDSVLSQSPSQKVLFVHGNARGADLVGSAWAKRNGLPQIAFPVTSSDWARDGKAAGPLRNQRMLDFAVSHSIPVALVAFPLGESRGTQSMLRYARSLSVTNLHISEFHKPA